MKSAHRPCPVPRRTRGFAMLEALIAMVVCAGGVLGVVGLQAAMTRAQTASTFRGEAAYLAQQLIGVMWSDRANLAGYASADCSAACEDWQNRLASRLPQGDSTVTVDAATGRVTIQIRWQAAGESTSQFNTVTIVRNS